MTHEAMNEVVQNYCDSNGCEKCIIHDLCMSVGGDFRGNKETCKIAFRCIAEQSETPNDSVNHPSHYETGKFECIDVMREAIGLENTKGFCLCNAFKYIYRCTKKHNTPVEDVKKAVWYLNKFLELEGEQND